MVELRHDGVKSFLSKHHEIVAQILNLRILKTFGDFIYAYVNNNIHFHKNKKKIVFQNEFMRSSFLPKCQPKVIRISALPFNKLMVEILVIFGCHFERNDDLIDSEFN